MKVQQIQKSLEKALTSAFNRCMVAEEDDNYTVTTGEDKAIKYIVIFNDRDKTYFIALQGILTGSEDNIDASRVQYDLAQIAQNLHDLEGKYEGR